MMKAHGTLFCGGLQVPIIATTEHAACSYGLPVIISGIMGGRDQTPYGPAELNTLAGRMGACSLRLQSGRFMPDDYQGTPELVAALRQAGYPVND